MSTDSEGTLISIISSTSLSALGIVTWSFFMIPSRTGESLANQLFHYTLRVSTQNTQMWLNLHATKELWHKPVPETKVIWKVLDKGRFIPRHHFAIGISSAVDFCISAIACLILPLPNVLSLHLLKPKSTKLKPNKVWWRLSTVLQRLRKLFGQKESASGESGCNFDMIIFLHLSLHAASKECSRTKPSHAEMSELNKLV